MMCTCLHFWRTFSEEIRNPLRREFTQNHVIYRGQVWNRLQKPLRTKIFTQICKNAQYFLWKGVDYREKYR